MVRNPVGDLVVRVSIAFGVIDTIAVALRLLARTRSKASLAMDDALITASLIPLYGMNVIGHLGQFEIHRFSAVLLTWIAVDGGGLGLTLATNEEQGHKASSLRMLLKLFMSAMVTVGA